MLKRMLMRNWSVMIAKSTFELFTPEDEIGQIDYQIDRTNR